MDAGSIRKHGTRCHNLRYIDKAMCCDIGQWFYESDYLSDGIIMNEKYQRHKLLLELFGGSAYTVADRCEMLNSFMEKEQRQSERTLKRLLLMATEEINSPEHWKFRKRIQLFALHRVRKCDLNS